MNAINYRVDWLEDWQNKPNVIGVRDFENNKQAAQAFARRKSAKIGSAYVIKSEDGKDIGQWGYTDGFTLGYEE